MTPTLSRYVSKNKQTIIIESKDSKVMHERKEERVENSYFGLISEECREKCNAKRSCPAPISRLMTCRG